MADDILTLRRMSRANRDLPLYHEIQTAKAAVRAAGTDEERTVAMEQLRDLVAERRSVVEAGEALDVLRAAGEPGPLL